MLKVRLANTAAGMAKPKDTLRSMKTVTWGTRTAILTNAPDAESQSRFHPAYIATRAKHRLRTGGAPGSGPTGEWSDGEVTIDC